MRHTGKVKSLKITKVIIIIIVLFLLLLLFFVIVIFSSQLFYRASYIFFHHFHSIISFHLLTPSTISSSSPSFIPTIHHNPSSIQSSSSYWEGNSAAESLQRIYGVSFPDPKMMKQWVVLQEEAAKRDHRKIGRVGVEFCGGGSLGW